MNQRKIQKAPTGDQAQKFIDKARELEADDDKVAFDERLKQLGKWKRTGEKDKPQLAWKK